MNLKKEVSWVLQQVAQASREHHLQPQYILWPRSWDSSSENSEQIELHNLPQCGQRGCWVSENGVNHFQTAVQQGKGIVAWQICVRKLVWVSNCHDQSTSGPWYQCWKRAARASSCYSICGIGRGSCRSFCSGSVMNRKSRSKSEYILRGRQWQAFSTATCTKGSSRCRILQELACWESRVPVCRSMESTNPQRTFTWRTGGFHWTGSGSYNYSPRAEISGGRVPLGTRRIKTTPTTVDCGSRSQAEKGLCWRYRRLPPSGYLQLVSVSGPSIPTGLPLIRPARHR